MADSNKAPNDFFDNWNKIQSMSYKNVIELLVKRSSEKKILANIFFSLLLFTSSSMTFLYDIDWILFQLSKKSFGALFESAMFNYLKVTKNYIKDYLY